MVPQFALILVPGSLGKTHPCLLLLAHRWIRELQEEIPLYVRLEHYCQA